MYDLTGKTFERLYVVRKAGSYVSPCGEKEPTWECICSCGKTVYVRGSMLRSGRQKSCGCYSANQAHDRAFKHGFCDKERLYRVWGLMRNRCNNPKSSHYDLYGGRGVRVCDEWDSYLNFREWALNHGYNDSLTIDRIDPDGDYCAENCRWVSQKVQCNNKRNNHYITYNGETKTMSEWSDYLGISYHVIRNRINKYGWSVERALTTPVRRCKRE